MATDIEQRLVEACVAILEANATLRDLTGQAGGFVRPEEDLAAARFPCITYLVVSLVAKGGVGRNFDAVVQFSAFAEGAGAGSTTRHMLEAIEEGLTQPLLAAQGLDALAWQPRRFPAPVEPEGNPRRRRATMDLTFWLTK